MPHPRHSVTVGGNNNNRTVPAKQEKRQPFPYSSTAILGEKSVINMDSRKDLIHLTATALKDAFSLKFCKVQTVSLHCMCQMCQTGHSLQEVLRVGELQVSPLHLFTNSRQVEPLLLPQQTRFHSQTYM